MDISVMDVLYAKKQSALEFQWDSLWVPSMYNYLHISDIEQLYNIATSIRYNSKIEKKYDMINKIMTNRGFKKFHAGTNRVVYQCLENPVFVIKIAIDKTGMGDNPAEYKNQFLLKPFVTKVFEVHPSGVIGTFERVDPILSREEYAYVASDVYDLLNDVIIGRYVLEDIGTNYFMNMGIRRGFGPVLLDFPYVYELDGNKLFCNSLLSDNDICSGEIDYDAGFNNLICTKCSKRYFARELEKSVREKVIMLKGSLEDTKIKTKLIINNEVVGVFDPSRESDIIRK